METYSLLDPGLCGFFRSVAYHVAMNRCFKPEPQRNTDISIDFTMNSSVRSQEYEPRNDYSSDSGIFADINNSNSLRAEDSLEIVLNDSINNPTTRISSPTKILFSTPKVKLLEKDHWEFVTHENGFKSMQDFFKLHFNAQKMDYN